MSVDYEYFSKALHDEGCIREEFEDFIKSLTAVKYSLERDDYAEYKNPSVFYMWTGFCMSKCSSESRAEQQEEV